MTVRRLVTRAETPAEELVLRAARADRAASLLVSDRRELRRRAEWVEREIDAIADALDAILRRRERLDAELDALTDDTQVWGVGRERLRVARAEIAAGVAEIECARAAMGGAA